MWAFFTSGPMDVGPFSRFSIASARYVHRAHSHPSPAGTGSGAASFRLVADLALLVRASRRGAADSVDASTDASMLGNVAARRLPLGQTSRDVIVPIMARRSGYRATIDPWCWYRTVRTRVCADSVCQRVFHHRSFIRRYVWKASWIESGTSLVKTTAQR